MREILCWIETKHLISWFQSISDFLVFCFSSSSIVCCIRYFVIVSLTQQLMLLTASEWILTTKGGACNSNWTSFSSWENSLKNGHSTQKFPFHWFFIETHAAEIFIIIIDISSSTRALRSGWSLKFIEIHSYE